MGSLSRLIHKKKKLHDGAAPRPESICWDCVHTGCSWIREHKPVEGSEHIEKVVYDKTKPNGKETLFVMTACPKFLREKRSVDNE